MSHCGKGLSGPQAETERLSTLRLFTSLCVWCVFDCIDQLIIRYSTQMAFVRHQFNVSRLTLCLPCYLLYFCNK